MASLGHRLESSLDGTLGRFPMYFFCVLQFYQSNYGGYTQVVLFFKVPPVSNYSTCYANCVPTRLVQQLCVYAFGALTTCLYVWCTYKALTNQGGGALVYRLCSLLYIIDSYHPNEHIILCILCPWIRLNCTIKLV